MIELVRKSAVPPGMSAADAAAFWLIRRDRGATLEDEPEFTSWLAASQEHADEWRRIVSAWDNIEAGDDLLLAAMRRDALAARALSGSHMWWAAAAACAAIIGVVGAVGWRSFVGGPVTDAQLIAENARPTFVSAVGAPSAFPLPDGSQVTLDTDSALAVAFTDGHRAVRLLRGQASFSVIHNAASPFSVEAGGRKITDLGTEFAVRMGAQSLRVTVVSGRVFVSSTSGAAPHTLAPGQELDAATGRNDQIVTVDVAQTLAWRTGYLEFHGQPLDQAVAEMNRYGGSPVGVADPSLGTLPVSGRFRVGSPARFAQALSDVYPLRLKPRPDGGVDIARR